MKKLLAVALVLCLLVPCVANANSIISIDFFIGVYNAAYKLYGGIEISLETAIETYGDEHTFSWKTAGENLILVVNDYGNVSGVIVAGDRASRSFLPMCFCAFVASSAESLKDKDFSDLMLAYFVSLAENNYSRSFKNDIHYKYVFREDENVLYIVLSNQDRKW
jgi:hypothetical protein